MGTDWELVEAGPPRASRTVLLLPGGGCNARSYAEVMAEPALADTRLVAATLPGQAGTAPPHDHSPEALGRIAAELAHSVQADVVVGFSMGATVAYEMAVSGAFSGPLVLLGSSLSAPDEPAFFRGIIKSASVLGTLPMVLIKKGAPSMIKKAAIPPERQAELVADFGLNKTHDMKASLLAYLKWLHQDDDRARRLCEVGVPVWVMHAEKGDGALTAHERSVFEACPHVEVVTIPGHVFFLPNEVPGKVAELVVAAINAGSNH